MNNYYVIVSNIGQIPCHSYDEAKQVYRDYVNQSKQNYGRAAGENVTLWHKDEIVQEYFGALHES